MMMEILRSIRKQRGSPEDDGVWYGRASSPTRHPRAECCPLPTRHPRAERQRGTGDLLIEVI